MQMLNSETCRRKRNVDTNEGVFGLTAVQVVHIFGCFTFLDGACRSCKGEVHINAHCFAIGCPHTFVHIVPHGYCQD